MMVVSTERAFHFGGSEEKARGSWQPFCDAPLRVIDLALLRHGGHNT